MYSVQLFLLNLFVVIAADGAYQNDCQQEGKDLCIWDNNNYYYRKWFLLNSVHVYVHACICMHE